MTAAVVDAMSTVPSDRPLGAARITRMTNAR
jgi:hypothetical protein